MVSVKDFSSEQVALLQRYRSGDVTTEEKSELFEFLNSLRDVPGFKLRPIVMDELSYNEFDFKRLNGEWYRYRRQMEKDETTATHKPERRTQEKTTVITKGATDRLFEEVKEIGTLLVAQYTKNAADRGETLKEYVVKSIKLREEYGDQIETLIQERDMLKALCSIFVEAAKPHFKQMAATRMYLDWITGLLQLQAMGVEVDPTYVDNITSQLEQVLQCKLT